MYYIVYTNVVIKYCILLYMSTVLGKKYYFNADESKSYDDDKLRLKTALQILLSNNPKSDFILLFAPTKQVMDHQVLDEIFGKGVIRKLKKNNYLKLSPKGPKLITSTTAILKKNPSQFHMSGMPVLAFYADTKELDEICNLSPTSDIVVFSNEYYIKEWVDVWKATSLDKTPIKTSTERSLPIEVIDILENAFAIGYGDSKSYIDPRDKQRVRTEIRKIRKFNITIEEIKSFYLKNKQADIGWIKDLLSFL